MGSTPKYLLKMRIFLLLSTTIHILLCSIVYITQSRNVINTKSVAILCNGACKYVGPGFCFVTYNLQLSLANSVAWINMHSLYYRYIVLTQKKNILASSACFSIFYIIPVAILVLEFIPPSDFELVETETREQHPEYDLSPSHFLSAIGLQFYFIADQGYFLAEESLIKLERFPLGKNSSSYKKTLIQGLTIQILTPILCYIPSGLLFLVSKYTGLNILLSQYTLSAMLTLPALIDPFVSIYFVMAMDSPYTMAFSIYYSVYFSIGLIIHTILLMLLKSATPNTMMRMRFFLFISTLGHISVCINTFILQARTLSNKNSMALLCNGACKWVGPELCLFNYSLQLGVSNFVALVNMHMLYFRYLILVDRNEPNRYMACFSIVYILPVIIVVISLFPRSDFELIREEAFRLHPEYDLSVYENFGGFSEKNHPLRYAVNFLLASESVIFPTRAALWLRSAVSKLHPLSERTRKQTKSFIKGLTIQIVTPVIFYTLSGASHLVSKYTGYDILLLQYLLSAMMTFPAIFDPFVTIYFVVMSYFPPSSFELVREETYRLHPEYDLSVYETFGGFGGFSNSHHPNRTIVNVLLTAETMILPIRSVFWVKAALLKLNPLSRKTQTLLKSLLQSLTIQTTAPFVCYVTCLPSHQPILRSTIIVVSVCCGCIDNFSSRL
ncbi:unnamed protein product [Caenorhabditis auriculariae]|uniref:G protein-coupled receptor n=1 Tax=Caenorhabditis auriculariae TaxID=2777116 RepID=A0A8S1H767_9PELO|nr:unnamed protein product [Caenorhabditis auriculariae]